MDLCRLQLCFGRIYQFAKNHKEDENPAPAILAINASLKELFGIIKPFMVEELDNETISILCRIMLNPRPILCT